MKMFKKSQTKKILKTLPTKCGLLIASLSFGLAAFGPALVANAAVTCDQTGYLGSLSKQFTIPPNEQGTYKAWVNVKGTAASTIGVEVVGNSCQKVQITPPASYGWVDTGVSFSLQAGSPTFKLSGFTAGLQVHDVMLIAFENCTPTGTGSNCDSLAEPLQPPTANLTTSTLQNQTAPGTVTVTASVSSDVTNVQFYQDNVALGVPVTAAPFSKTVTGLAAKALPYSFTAKACTSTTTNCVTTNAVSVVVSAPTAPTISLTNSTLATQTEPGSVALTATASANTTKVEFYQNGTLLSNYTKTSAPYTAAINGLAASSTPYTFKAVATNAAGSTTSNVITVTVNPKPVTPVTISLSTTSPASQVGTGTVALTTTVSSNVTKVEFYQNGALLSNLTDTSTPFSATVGGLQPATNAYSFTAKAYAGTSTNPVTSNAISVYVAPAASDTPSVPTGIWWNPFWEWFDYKMDLGWKASTGTSPIVSYEVLNTDTKALFVSSYNGIRLNNIQSDHTYHFEIRAINKAGVKSQPGKLTATPHCFLFGCSQ